MTKKKKIIICLILITVLISIPIGRSIYFFRKGYIALAKRYHGESEREFEKSIKINPYFIEAYVCLAAAYTDWGSKSIHYKEYDEEGFIKLKNGTLGKAEEILKTALRRFPYHVYRDDIQYMLGEIYDQDPNNGNCVWDRQKALEGYKELIRKYPKSRYAKKVKERIKDLEKDRLVASQ